MAVGGTFPEFDFEVGTADGNFGFNAAMNVVGFGDVSGQNLAMEFTGVVTEWYCKE